MKQFVFALAILSTHSVCAGQDDLIVTEVMANEPGSYVALEWIELHLPPDVGADAHLLDYSIIVNGIDINPRLPCAIRPGEYVVLCRQLYADGIIPGFESVWGDGSGSWGDHASESYAVIEADRIALYNEFGEVRLVRGEETAASLSWKTEGGDGVSWELSEDGEVRQSFDQSGSTPGRPNSIEPLVVDLALSVTDVVRSHDSDIVTLTVVNFGTADVTAVPVIISDSFDDLVLASQTADVRRGDSSRVDISLHLSQPYPVVTCRLPDDAEPGNNRVELQLPGNPFPAVILSEIMAAPEGGLSTEWIELANISDDTVLIRNWIIADPHTSGQFGDQFRVEPKSFVVLADDSTAFRLYYSDYAGPVVQPSSWPALNNSGDTVVLIDHFGNQLDRAVYTDAPLKNRSLSRHSLDPAETMWGVSLDPNGSPGTRGDAFVQSNAPDIGIDVSSQYVDPTYPSSIQVTLRYPEALSFSLKVYDRHGRVVQTIIDDASVIPSTVYWDGRSDDGTRLPIGPYILLFDVAGYGSAKKLIVVAR